MNNSRLLLMARLGVASVIGLFTFAFVTDAVGNIGYSAFSAAIGAVVGVVTFAGGTLIALRSGDDHDRPTVFDAQENHVLAQERGDDTHREPLLTDLLTILMGPMFIAIGYLKLIENNIGYAPGDYRLTTGYHQLVFSLGLVIGVLLIVVGSIRLALRLRRRRQ